MESTMSTWVSTRLGRYSLASALVVALGACPACAQNGLAKDWKRAVWRVPVHIALSLPVTAATMVVPPLGKKYVGWRTRAEANHVATGHDTPQKATIDLYTQTALPRRVLKWYHIKMEAPH